ncbi:hypothetical protein [Campylobacter gracilis]|uniref:Uncharacterized protein n=1 Tax=Campylobacter gracilis RM3268 TaxID=553220 RepID=C8PGS5_9BACT|nr:hypothetical protein [Campylobacter gracilis]AKT92497.1 hypothetical protein CGRAC_1047 [Campylobacter gracilis]EEV18313.1 hypothetical protein CAMGR0001_1070 [Campylobacter gracilis RM3268]UEB45322.1 hypothetical protein LK410_10100 [Campylobacter gracilis]SUW82012.1 Uncharacterised protein [Campylobacter gracilis]
MPNAVNSAQYLARIKQAEALFEGQNFTRRQTINLGSGYEIVKDAYRLGAANFSGGEYTLFGAPQIISWRSIDDRAEFFSLIRHANGKFYLIFRQDLYGYSVLELDRGRIMRFVPDAWTLGKESFIWGGVHYLRGWDALAVSGCYWGAPNGVHLVSFAEPMSEEQRYVDVLDCMQGGYDIYEQADFAGFEGNELSLKCFRADALRYEKVKISREQYREWMREAKRL